MTKKEENQPNSSINFKLKLVRRPEFAWKDKIETKAKGIYEQLNNKPLKYSPGSFSLDTLGKALEDIYKAPPKERKVVIHVNEAGLELFNKAMLEEQLKKVKANEYRKKLSFGGKIFK